MALFVLIAATPTSAEAQTTDCPSATCFCGATVTGTVVFRADLLCMDESGLTVGASNTQIFLNGFRLQCAGGGFNQSCQGPLMMEDIDIGISIPPNLSNVRVRGPGSIVGFDQGVKVTGGFGHQVERIHVSGPDALGGLFSTIFTMTGERPLTQGILVENVGCPDSGHKIHRNSVDNHTIGIELRAAHCIEIMSNFLHDGNSGSQEFTGDTSHGIALRNSSNNRIHSNMVIDNGINLEGDAGILLDEAGTRDNVVANNLVSYNNGDGILAINDATANRISNNNLMLNTSTEPTTPTLTDPDPTALRAFFDLAEKGTTGNRWDANNRCETETSPPIASTVCNAGEATDPIKK